MNRILLFSCWVLSLLTAYWFGISTSLEKEVLAKKSEIPKPSTFKTGYIPSPTAKSDFSETVVSSEPEIYRLDESHFQDPVTEKSESIQPRYLSEELISSHPIERMEAFAKLLKNPDQLSIESALRAYESLPQGPGRFSELKMLAFAWAQVDPEGALSWAQKQEHWDEHIASSSIMDSWARLDSDAAIAWAKENFEGQENPFFVGIINGLSEESLPKATDLMTELPYGRVRGRAAHLLFEKVWSKGEQVAMHWAEHLPEGSLQNFAYGELGEKVAQNDMPRAMEWIESMEESSLKSAVTEKIAKEMARESPVETANWINSLPEGESKKTAMNQLAEIWTRKDPVATAEWINQMPSDVNKDPLIETLVNKIHKSDPESALVWAETIENPQRRKHMTEKVIKVIKSEKFSTEKTN